jgi:hypothetical protein
MNKMHTAQLPNFPTQYATAIKFSYARSMSQIEQPFVAASCALSIFPVLLVSIILLYRSYRARQLRKHIETLKGLWKLDQNNVR